MPLDLVQPVEHGGILTQSTWSATGRREICGRNSSPLAYLSVLQTRYPLLTVCHVARKYVWCDATGEEKALPHYIDSYWQTLVVSRQIDSTKVIICQPVWRYGATVGTMSIDIPAISKLRQLSNRLQHHSKYKYFIFVINVSLPIPVVARSKCLVLRPIDCWDYGFEYRRRHWCLSCECCVLSGRGLRDGPITRPEESYRVWYRNLDNDEP